MPNNELTKRDEQQLTLKEKLDLIKKAPFLLVDVSASMSSDVEPGCSKHAAVQSLVNSITGRVRIMAFNYAAIELPNKQIPQPSGGTALSPALRHIKANGCTEAVVITDGEINEWDQELTLEEAKGIKLKVFYVGAGERPDFLRRLAEQSGGFCTKEDLKNIKQLTNKVTLLLEAPKEKKGPICL